MNKNPHVGFDYIITKKKEERYFKTTTKSRFYNSNERVVYPFYKPISLILNFKKFYEL